MKEVIIVTGASSGIGRSLSLELALRRKKNVLAVSRDHETLKKISQLAPDLIEIIKADISTVEGRKKIIDHLSLKKLHVFSLVNNAAIMKPSGLLESVNLEEWRYQMSVNVEAPLFLTKEILPFIAGGRILNLSIYSSSSVTVGLGSYAISKSALNMMTEYLRIELEKYNVLVAGVLPGIVDTKIQNQLPDSGKIKLRDKINLLKQSNKLLSPKLAAEFLTWLLLDCNSDEFSKNSFWDIYDKTHQKYWSKGVELSNPIKSIQNKVG